MMQQNLNHSNSRTYKDRYDFSSYELNIVVIQFTFIAFTR